MKRFARISLIVPVLVGLFALTVSGCEPRGGFQAKPNWYSELRGFSGVNIPALGAGLSIEYIDHPSFSSNLRRMQFTAIRVPSSWSSFANPDGTLDLGRVEEAKQVFRALVAKLKVIHDEVQSSKRIFLILDFHQFKFGPVCGGDGIPRGAVDETGLNPSDPNCLFLGWGKFWKNDRGVIDGWLAYARQMVEILPEIAKENENWLTLGLEPINEPFAGVQEPIISGNILSTFQKLGNYMSADQKKQIDSNLIPFYRKFVAMLAQVPSIDDFLSRSLLIMDPFLLDFNEWVLYSVPQIILSADGRYKGMTSLMTLPGTPQPIYWIAGPHHYAGSYDEAIRDLFPADIQEGAVKGLFPPDIQSVIDRYPNRIFDRQVTFERMRHMKDRFAEAGMDYFIGEWGTYTRLKDASGNAGGYREWIRDTQDAMKDNAFGWMWWRYSYDYSKDQTSYDLLRGVDDQGRPLDYKDQRLKCGSGFDIVKLLFGRCTNDEARTDSTR